MGADDYLSLGDEALLGQCDVHVYRSSGPGGQHRSKVSSAVRFLHRPTGIAAHGDDSRSQHQNKRMAIRRLRMNIACAVRGAMASWGEGIPPTVAECIFTPRGRGDAARPKLAVGVRDQRFWRVAAFVLDVLAAYEGRLSDAAAHLGISTGNLASFLQSDRHLLTAVQAIRKAHGHKPLS